MINLNPTDSNPLYEQICEKFKELIIGGYLTENDKMPSVRELATSLSINPNTIAKAYKTLESEGYIFAKPAKGYFVKIPENNNQKVEKLFDEFSSVVKELSFLGITKDELIKEINKNY